MKKHLAIMLVMLTICGCKKKTEEDTSFHPVYPNYYGSVTALRNRRLFEGKIIVLANKYVPGCINLGIDELSSDGFYWDRIIISGVPVTADKTNLTQYNEQNKNKPAVVDYNGSFDYGSDAISFNHLDTTFPHYISITKYDSTTKEIWGNFECTFVKDHPTSLKPDTVRYERGEFYTKIQ